MSDEIAHYTTEQGLAAILSTKKLWATHWRFLNDLSETQHGIDIINDIHRATLDSMPDQNILRKRLEQEGPQFLKNLWFKCISPNGKDPEFFMTSFSKIFEKDKSKDDGILSQWRSYGDNGGFAIVFSREGLRKSYYLYSKKCETHAGEEQKYGCPECQKFIIAHTLDDTIYPVNILEVKEENYKNALEIIRYWAPALIKSDVKKFSSETIDAWVKAIILLITTIKHPGFNEEKEVRFACLNRVERPGGGYHLESPYKVVMKNNAPRLEIDFQPETIKRIIIGPQPNQDQKELAVRYYLESNGYEGVDVVKSSIPYRKNISA